MKPLPVLLLSDGVPGHVNQARGLAAHLQRAGLALEVREQALPMRGRSLVRPLLRWLLNRHPGSPWIAWLCDRAYPGWRSVIEGDEQLILSAGGNTSFLNAMLGQRPGVANVFIGSLRGLDSARFTAVMTLEPVPGSDSNIVMDVPPTRMSPATARTAAQSHPLAGSGRLWALVVGGEGAGFEYGPGDWQHLARAMAALAHHNGVRWLITTSRRTGADNERLLRDQLDHGVIAEAIWYHDNPQSVIAAYLGLAERVFVTMDSMSMIAEAIEAGHRPVILAPKHAVPNQRFNDAIGRFCSANLAIRVSMAQMTALPADAGPVTERNPAYVERLARRLRDRIGANDQGPITGNC